jgi:hypothetical protein
LVSDLLVLKGYNIYLSPRLIDEMTEEEVQNLIDLRINTEPDIGLPHVEFSLFEKRFIDKA